ncbi:MAG: D-glycero-beta-D-manno-heptose 1,7-bisphosphate 7-phosphatase [Treponema sp.]|jgi:D,D-heptose 1,7-bisphosphate phosphatase|nr:D-glycero-beta-D-manno-heptose 1,7-bisphosphate 7-phosphatase [Treponema sp.]
MKVIIMAGGKGTRIASMTGDIPKPMIPVCGKPVLEHQIEVLKRNDLTDLIISVGYLGQDIKDYFEDGSRFGCSISYFTETSPLGTAGILYKLENLSGDFIVVNGDIIFDMDFSRMITFHTGKKALVTLAVHPNNHPFDSTLIITDTNNKVTGWLNKEDARTYYKNTVNAGIHILSAEFLKNCSQSKEKIDLDRDMLKPSISGGKIFAYHTPEYIKDMGTPERYAQVTADIESGIVQRKNLAIKQKAVFLDRDGTINTFNGFVTKPEGFELIDGAAEAIKKINSLGYLAIVITNQPVIARGEADLETLDLIHMKMETELGKKGAYIDGLFYCPHHPDKGFPGEQIKYKINCTCRKPKPGMILQAAEKYNIDLAESFMVGDDMCDVQAGVNAGCTPIYLTNGRTCENFSIKTFKNLRDFVEHSFP